MDELHRSLADKLRRELDHLESALTCEGPLDEASVGLALSIAKRVRRDSTLLVRQLASHRDQLQP